MPQPSGSFEIRAFVGFISGLAIFMNGFKTYRKLRLLEVTPEMPIRGIAMGIVHIHGKAHGDVLITSPVTETPCYLYKVIIEKYAIDALGNGSWNHYKTDINLVRFYLEDRTGKVLVDPLNAEYDLLESGKRKTGASFGSGARNLLGGMDDAALKTGPAVSDSSLISYAEGLALCRSSASETLGDYWSRGSSNKGWSSGSSGQYRFTEYCILKDHWYDLTGTCTENPNPRDELDRNLIMKGQNEPTFLISWRNEKGIEAKLRNRAVLYIFGGAIISVVCLWMLLVDRGWF